MSVVLSGNSLLVQASLVLCFINSEIQTAFQLDQFGDVVFEDPVSTGSEDYATEGRNGFCCISFRYHNLLYSVSFYPKSFTLSGTLFFSWLAFPPWVALAFKVPSRTFSSVFCCNWTQKVIIYAYHNEAAPVLTRSSIGFEIKIIFGGGVG